jgi:hypothetical protein
MSFYESGKPEINAALRQRDATVSVRRRIPGISFTKLFHDEKGAE